MFRYSYKYVLSLDIVSVFCTAVGKVYTCIGSTYSVGTISATILSKRILDIMNGCVRVFFVYM